MQMQYRFRALVFNYDARIAMGVMHRIEDVNGYTLAGLGAAQQRAAGGVLATISNLGQRSSNEFAAAPHIRLGLGRRDPWEAQEKRQRSSVEIVRRNLGKGGQESGEATH